METFAQRLAPGSAAESAGAAPARAPEPGVLVTDEGQRVLAASEWSPLRADGTALAPEDYPVATVLRHGPC